MTPEKTTQPFLMRFSQKIEWPIIPTARYDESRCLVQFLIDDEWIDAPDAPVDFGGTRETLVAAETSDDS